MAPGKELVSHCWPESTSKDVTGVLCPCALLSCVLLRDGDVGYGTGTWDMTWKPWGGDAEDSSRNTGGDVGALGMEMVRMAWNAEDGTDTTAWGRGVWYGDLGDSTGTLGMAWGLWMAQRH